MKTFKFKVIFFMFVLFVIAPVFVKADPLPDPVPSCDTYPTLCTPPPAPSCATDPTLCPPPPDPVIPTENILIRNGDNVIFQGNLDLPTAGNIDITDNTGANHSVNSDSVLGILYSLDQANESFSISNLQYYDSFGAFYLKCITSVGEVCDNWQYVVGGTTPWQSIDQTILTGGESIGIYFGSPYKVVLDQNNITTSDTLNVTSEKYDYENNVWNIRGGVTVGLTQPDPNNPWSPTEAQTSLVDSNGVASFTNIGVGNYNVGIKEDYYFPTESLTVTAPIVSGGGGGSLPPPSFSIPNAISYLTTKQNTDGSFGADLYTDWASVALSAGNISLDVKNKILTYMSAHNSISGNLTDNERHSMALLSLGQNPYSYNGVDYITPIINSFDGAQFGDTNLINDDIFALIPLASSGYSSSDDIITKDINFIISKQKTDGSFEESIDMTSATILALSNFSSVNGVSNVISSASFYLINQQGTDGGWGNVSATSWVLQAESATGASWIKNGESGIDYLTTNQSIDGGLLNNTETLDNRIWTTSYALPAVLGKTWNQIFTSVSKPVSGSCGSSCLPPPVQITPTCDTDPTLCLPVVKTEVVKEKVEIEKVLNLPVKDITPKTISVKKVKKIIEIKNIKKEISKIEPVNITATAGNSGIKIPIIVSIIAVLGLSMFIIFRFVI